MDRCRKSQDWTTACTVVCPNVTRRTKERIAQSKRARAGSLAIELISHKWRELVSSGRLVCVCHVVFSGMTFVVFCFVFFFMLSLKPRLFVQSFFVFDMHASRQPDVFLPFFCFYGDVAFSEYFCAITVFSLYGDYY